MSGLPGGIRRSPSTGRLESALPGDKREICMYLTLETIALLDLMAAESGTNRSVALEECIKAATVGARARLTDKAVSQQTEISANRGQGPNPGRVVMSAGRP